MAEVPPPAPAASSTNVSPPGVAGLDRRARSGRAETDHHDIGLEVPALHLAHRDRRDLVRPIALLHVPSPNG